MEEGQLWFCLDIRVRQQEYESTVALLVDLNTCGFQEFEGSEHIRLRAYFGTNRPLTELDACIRSRLERNGAAADFQLEPVKLDPGFWLREYRAHFSGFPIGDTFFIYPSWESPPLHYPIPLLIEPGAGFGTGTHESTRLALRQLEALEGEISTILDVGTGSGILAIAAAKMYPGARVFAIDTDYQATRAAQQNVERNCTPAVQLVCGGVESLDLQPDVVVANLTRAILREKSGPIAQVSGKALIVSGFTVEQESEVRATFEERGFGPGSMLREGGWSSLLLTRSGRLWRR